MNHTETFRSSIRIEDAGALALDVRHAADALDYLGDTDAESSDRDHAVRDSLNLLARKLEAAQVTPELGAVSDDTLGNIARHANLRLRSAGQEEIALFDDQLRALLAAAGDVLAYGMLDMLTAWSERNLPHTETCANAPIPRPASGCYCDGYERAHALYQDLKRRMDADAVIAKAMGLQNRIVEVQRAVAALGHLHALLLVTFSEDEPSRVCRRAEGV